ncbi:hypothetical protein THI_3702 [Thiomonas arsenitoxydans]|uniref:Uncharacterized protein n=1 Tax=Thiomonas arsenitoxydans (strain DSM 22701 / CIP 110005 / 3As) TaxID=426114 RepID=D6CP01_THIA3|nr:hypothetical protein THI_3702 [Thiomonas arsenitoxydans]
MKTGPNQVQRVCNHADLVALLAFTHLTWRVDADRKLTTGVLNRHQHLRGRSSRQSPTYAIASRPEYG